MEAKVLSEAKVYVGTYVKYNNGSLSGAWLDLSDYSDKEEFYEACRELHKDEEDAEYMFQDWENVPEGLIDESWISENFFALRDAVEDLSDTEQEAFFVWCNYKSHDLGEEEADDLVRDFRDEYQGQYDDEEDFAYEIILKSIIDSESVLQAVLQYLDWRIYGFFFSFTIIMFRAFYIGIIHTSALMLNSITMVAINVILNYILIFGALGIPALGISGAAIASVISEAVAVIHFIIYTQKNVSSCKYGLKRRITIDCTILKKILSISIWMMLQHGLVFGSWFVFFITIEHFGERALAITNIVRNISSFLFLFVQAFASVVSSLVGNLIGENKSSSILYVCKKVIFLCYMTILPIMLLFLFFPSSVLRIYSDNTILVFEAIPTLKVMLTSYLIAVPTFVFFSAVSGIGHTVASLLIAFISLVVYIVYVETISHFSSSVPLLWTSEHIYFSCVFILSLYYIHHWWMNFINQDKKLITNVS